MKVYKSIAAMTGELSKVGIAKSNQNKQQGYKFRGIDDVYGVLSPMLAQHQLCILPRVLERSVSEQQSKSGGTLFYTVLKMEFDIVSAEDGSKHTVCTIGEAMDSGDKSSNKAMSAAYKYACFQAFCIPVEGDNDADGTTHEVETRATQDNVRSLAKRFREVHDAGIDGAMLEVHESANRDQELYKTAWALLPANVRARLKEGIARAQGKPVAQNGTRGAHDNG